MCKLTYEEFILLDNLIYLQWDTRENEKLIDIVYNLLENWQFNKFMNNVGNCMIKMSEDELINILYQIKNRPNLKNLRVRNVDSYKSAMRFACFEDDESNAIVVFRGTSTTKEWEDNGEGAYKYDTVEQIDALNYINSLNYDYITVTGHSKGGNNAQYVTILSPKITKCISIDGQGFSNEFINKYKKEINKNKSKIISINAKYDYVYCLFNSISRKSIYIQTEIQNNPFDYHKLSVLLDESGNLRPETSESIFSKIINYFSIALITNLPDEIKYLIIETSIDVIELILCKGKNKDNILKIAGEFLIMFCYENYFNYKDIFNIFYPVLEILILPLIFWGDFVEIEETKSKENLNNIISNINILGEGITKKLKIIDKDNLGLIESISDAINSLTYKLENETLQF